MARCELGCYGGQNLATPNIDRVASEGMRMTNNFASVAMSVPIRASMYTGLYPAHHGSFQNHKATYTHVKSVTHYLSDLENCQIKPQKIAFGKLLKFAGFGVKF